MIRITSSLLALTVALSVATPAFAKRICANLGPNGWVILDIKPFCKPQKLGKLKLSSIHGVYNNSVSGCRSALTGTCIGDENGVRLAFGSASTTCDDFLVEFSGDDLTQSMVADVERVQTSDHPTSPTAFTNFIPRDCREVPFPL